MKVPAFFVLPVPLCVILNFLDFLAIHAFHGAATFKEKTCVLIMILISGYQKQIHVLKMEHAFITARNALDQIF